MTESSGTGVEALLRADSVALAASTFVRVFAGVGLGREQARYQVGKELHRQFGKPHSDDHYAYEAIVLQLVLVWEQARVAARAHSGVLILLPDGVRLLAATDATDELRALLSR
ncbi:hypothetical protein [Promicromonospora iranensis]|uniref:Uncharacterized protein n=1 Tax=Promicromonospora iranensis TaxID=1105144 RepID=A0ABU2CWA9_9MICO|nr:hypothetical protein [Promicromonospora iranensis]MDR7385632.1 hypothetical protein [Promicromonospora iranensis]